MNWLSRRAVGEVPGGKFGNYINGDFVFHATNTRIREGEISGLDKNYCNSRFVSSTYPDICVNVVKQFLLRLVI